MPQIKNNIFSWLFLTLSFAGFLDAFYLSLEKYRGGQVICGLTSGCNKVLASAYSTIGDIPVAFLGTLYYFIIFFLVWRYFLTKNEKNLNLAAKITLIGFAASLWFVYLQIFVLRAFCVYCLFSAAISALLFVLGMYFLLSKKFCQKNGHSEPREEFQSL